MVAHAFNPTVLGRQREVELYEFKASLVSKESTRTGSKATQREDWVAENRKRRNRAVGEYSQ